MMRAVFILMSFALSSCGLLGLYKDDTNYDPDFQRNAIAEINNRPIAREQDSLLAIILSASIVIPTNIDQTILIFETYKYEDFLRIQANKFNLPQDTKRRRKYFGKYQKDKTLGRLIKNPKYDVVYIDKGEYENLDKDKYRYVLRTTNRLYYDPKNLIVRNDGHVYSWFQTVVYYIYDRQTGELFGEIKDLEQLSEK